jgi:hypothetical protein
LHRLESGARPAPQVFTRGVYASEFEGPDILGYAMPNTGNNPPTCQVPAANVNDVNVDPVGDLIDPDGGTGSVIVYKGPAGCGSELGSFVDPFGQPSDAVSINAATDTIAVGNIFDNSGTAPGGISVCTLTGPINCPTNLTNPAMYEVIGVAMDGNGNCWASALNASSVPTLTYFAGCAGPGVATSGYENVDPSGIDIDPQGHLIAIDPAGAMYVYSGCQPECTLISKLPMHPGALFGHFARGTEESSQFVAGNEETAAVDVYLYGPKVRLTYKYSFSNGLVGSLLVEGATFFPAPTPPVVPPPSEYPTEIVNYWAHNPATTPTDIDLVFQGDVRAALGQQLPLYGIYDAFCPEGDGPCTTGSTSTVYNPTADQTTFTMSGTNGLSQNSYYTTQSHFALLYGEGDIPSLPCPEAAAEWSFASAPPQPVAWASMNYVGCVPPTLRPNTTREYYWIVYFESSLAPITPLHPATSGQWFELASPNSKEQPQFTFTNYGTQTIYTAHAGIVNAGLVPTSPDCQQNQTCPANINRLAALNYTDYPPKYMPGTKFIKMKFPPPTTLPPTPPSRVR